MPVTELMLSRLVLSMSNKSTCGVNMMPGGKWPLIPTGATNPGPYSVESPFGLGTSGLDCTSRWVIVV